VSGSENQRQDGIGAGRLRLLALCFVLAFGSIGLRLVDMVTAEPRVAATSPRGADQGIELRRAAIKDRNGELLAANIVTLSVVGDPLLMNDPEEAAIALARALDGVAAADLNARFARGGRFAWVKRQISPQEQAAVLELGLPGISFDLGERRVYPRGHEAAHVLGFTGIDNQGLAGIEYGMEAALRGGAAMGKEDIALSIDRRVQRIAHAATRTAVDRFAAVGACTIVLDIGTREVLALVSLPDYDPNRAERAAPEARRNRCTSDVLELGSLFKVVSAAMALESGAVSIYDRFDASEVLRIGRHSIRDFRGHQRWLSVPEIFAFSSNIGTVKMTFAAGGPETQKPFLEHLGLFSRPALEVPETTQPLVQERWPEIVAATVSYGHGISVSPLQFTEAVAALVGDGKRIPATFLRRDPAVPPDGPQVVSERTIKDLRWLMWLTVERGTGANGGVRGYMVGGKTGTADKPTGARRGYDGRAVVSSFIGVFPVDAPRYAVLSVLDEPKGDARTYGFRTGGWTAAPVVSRIIAQAGPLLGVPPRLPATEAAFNDRLQVMPVMNGRTKRMEDGFAAASLTR
jgi:cell division protein FtsI (penicillin-binding protein 3)